MRTSLVEQGLIPPRRGESGPLSGGTGNQSQPSDDVAKIAASRSSSAGRAARSDSGTPNVSTTGKIPQTPPITNLGLHQASGGYKSQKQHTGGKLPSASSTTQTDQIDPRDRTPEK